MFAIIETGGKQFKVTEGGILRVPKLGTEKSDAIVFDNIILLNDGEKTILEPKKLKKVSIECMSMGDKKAKKIIVFKKKKRKGYKKKRGHRQEFTELVVQKIKH